MNSRLSEPRSFSRHGTATKSRRRLARTCESIDAPHLYMQKRNELSVSWDLKALLGERNELLKYKDSVNRQIVTVSGQIQDIRRRHEELYNARVKIEQQSKIFGVSKSQNKVKIQIFQLQIDEADKFNQNGIVEVEKLRWKILEEKKNIRKLKMRIRDYRLKLGDKSSCTLNNTRLDRSGN